MFKIFKKKGIQETPEYKSLEVSYKRAHAERQSAFDVARNYNRSLKAIAAEVASFNKEDAAHQTFEDDYKRKVDGDGRAAVWPSDLSDKVQSIVLAAKQAIDAKNRLEQEMERTQEEKVSWVKRSEKATSALEGAEEKILANIGLHKLMSEFTRRLQSADKIYISAWTATEEELPVFLDALREYCDKCNADEHRDGVQDFEYLKALSYVSEEAQRIAQYDAILRLYNDRIAKMRSEDMDDEDKEDAIQALRELRDVEMQELTRASDA